MILTIAGSKFLLCLLGILLLCLLDMLLLCLLNNGYVLIMYTEVFLYGFTMFTGVVLYGFIMFLKLFFGYYVLIMCSGTAMISCHHQ